MKRMLIVIGLLTQLVFSQAANAITFGDSVNYWTNWASSDASDNTKDVIGHPDIQGGNVLLNSNRTVNQISFTNVGSSWNDLYTSDLFINVLTGANDTTWDYIVRGGQKLAGNNQLFKITGAGLSAVKGSGYGNSGYVITDDVATEPSIRNDHPTAVDLSLLNTRHSGNPYGILDLGMVSFSGLTQGFLTTYDFTANSQVQIGDMGFILGWGVTCANDMIYEQIPVPEPGTLVLLGAGLLGLGLFGKRRMKKSA